MFRSDSTSSTVFPSTPGNSLGFLAVARRRAGLTFAMAFAFSVATLGGAASVSAQQRVMLQGGNRLVIVDRDGRIEWEMPWGGIHDIWVLENGHIVVQQGASKVAEIDPKTKQVVWSYDSATQNGNKGKRIEVHAFQPLGKDRMMIVESGAARIIEINRQGELLSERKLTVKNPNAHTDTRLARKIANGNFLVCHEGDGTVREYDANTGAMIWEYEVPLFGGTPKGGHGPEAYGNKCFAAVRLPNGNTLITTGNGHSVIEVTPDKKVVWKVGQRELDKIVLAWVTTIEVLPNGHYVIGNCHAGPGQPLLIELEPKSKRVVWTLDRHKDFGNNVSNSWVMLDEGRTLR